MLTPKFVWHSTSDQLSEFTRGIELALAADISSILVLACSQNGFKGADIDPIITSLELPVFGGIYPMLISGNKSLEQGMIIVGFSTPVLVNNIGQLSEKVTYLEGLELTISKNPSLTSQANFLMFYDALCYAAEDFVECFYDCVGSGISVAGGGAGSLDLIQRPCIFTNDGLVADTIQVVSLPVDLQLGVAHGWEILDGPYLVTEAAGSVVKSLNCRPAIELYQSRVEQLGQHRFSEHDFFEIAKHFPLGIVCPNGEILVRDPIKTFGKDLQCVANVPVNSMVSILKGQSESLIASARNAAHQADSLSLTESLSSMIVFDCVSRVLYLEQEFERELSAINACAGDDVTVFGVLSLGEVANTQSGAIGLLNKSTVIGRF